MKNLIVILFFLPVFAFAQISHTVAPKETLYSLGRQYNIHPKELAAYNNISIETGLNIGQVIKIPAKGKLAPVKNTAEVKIAPAKTRPAVVEMGNVPQYHKVEKKETLYGISKKYSNVTVDQLKEWNHLTSDGVSEGTNLIVGYQKGKKGAVISEVVVTDVAPAKKVTPEPQSTVVINEKPAEVIKPVVTKPSEPVKETITKTNGKNSGGGYFKPMYTEQSLKKSIVEESGTAAIFKSTSGWQDGKYYCLHNTATAGSIIKITNKANQRSVYAKVLDVIPDLKQNTGILIRLSNAAADELGAGENNFEALLNY